MITSNRVLHNPTLSCFITKADKMILIDDPTNRSKVISHLRPPIFAICDKGHVSRYTLGASETLIESNELKECRNALLVINKFISHLSYSDREHIYNVLSAYNIQNIMSEAISTRHLIERAAKLIYFDKYISQNLTPSITFFEFVKDRGISKFLNIIAQKNYHYNDVTINQVNSIIQDFVRKSEFNLCDCDIKVLLSKLPGDRGYYRYLSKIIHGEDPGDSQKVFNAYKDIITLLSLVRW